MPPNLNNDEQNTLSPLYNNGSHPEAGGHEENIDDTIHAIRRRRIIIMISLISGVIIAIILFFVFYLNKQTTNNTPLITGADLPTGREIRGTNFYLPNEEQKSEIYNESTPIDERALVSIWDKPTAGSCSNIIGYTSTSTVYNATGTASEVTTKGTSSAARFMDKATGYVYQYIFKTKSLTQLSSTRLDNVFDSTFIKDCQEVLVRYDKSDGKELSGNIYQIPTVKHNEDAKALLRKHILPDNIISVSSNNTASAISFTVSNQYSGDIYEYKGLTSPSIISKNLLREWNSLYGGNVSYKILKPTAYEVSSLIRSKDGLIMTAAMTGMSAKVSPDNKKSLISMNSNSGLVMINSSLNGGEQKTYTIRTLADKCAMDNTSVYALCGVPKNIPQASYGYPDDWYMGLVNFDDEIGILGLKAISEDLYFSFKEETDRVFDVYKPYIDNKSSYFVFINKTDASLWAIDIGTLERKRNK